MAAASAMIIAAVISMFVAKNQYIVAQACSWLGASAVAGFMLIHDKTGTYMRTLVISLCAMALLGISQFATSSVSPSSWLGISAQNAQTQGVPVVLMNGERMPRPFGSMPHPNIYGGFSALLMLMAGVLYTHKKYQAYASIVYIIGMAGVMVSFSRSAWLMGLIVCSYLWLHARTNRLMQSMMNITFIAGTAFILLYYPAIMTRLEPRQDIERRSIDERLSGIETALELMQQNKWLGTGLHNYTHALADARPELPGYALVPVHNTLLLMVTELGLTVISLLAYALYTLKHRLPWRAIIMAIVILLPVLMFDHYAWSLYPGIMMSILTLTMSSILNTKSDH